MQRTIPSTLVESTKLALATDSKLSSYAAIAESATIPPTNAHRAGESDGPVGANGVIIAPCGIGSDNNTGKFQVVGLTQCDANNLMDGFILCQFDFTLCGYTKSIGASTYRMADTIAASSGSPGTAGVDYVITQGVTDQPAEVFVDLKGHQYYRIDPIIGDATSVNALVRKA